MTLTIGIFILMASVLLGGGIVVYLHKINQGRLIKILLSLSGGFLLAIAFVHFIPEMYAYNKENIGYFILLGFLVQLFLEYFSGGIEHGHIHAHGKKGTIPWSLFIALSFHAFFEAMPLEAQFFSNSSGIIQESIHHHHHHHDMNISNSFLMGIVLHKIPVAIALMTLLLSSGFKKSKAWLVLIAFSLMSPLGLLFGHYGSANALFDSVWVLAMVVGMFLHISTTIIFEASDNHKFNFIKLVSLLAGVGLAVAFV